MTDKVNFQNFYYKPASRAAFMNPCVEEGRPVRSVDLSSRAAVDIDYVPESPTGSVSTNNGSFRISSDESSQSLSTVTEISPSAFQSAASNCKKMKVQVEKRRRLRTVSSGDSCGDGLESVAERNLEHENGSATATVNGDFNAAPATNSQENHITIDVSSDDDALANGEKFKAKRTPTNKIIRNSSSVDSVIDIGMGSEVATERVHEKFKAKRTPSLKVGGSSQQWREECQKTGRRIAGANHESESDGDVDLRDANDFKDGDESESSDDEQSTSSHGQRPDSVIRTRLVSYFNTASLKELSDIPLVSEQLAVRIVELRPFANYKDLCAKFESSKGSGKGNTLSVKIVERYEEMLERQDDLDCVLVNCSNLSRTLQLTAQSILSGKSANQLLTEQPKCLNENYRLKPYQLLGLNWLLLMHNRKLNAVLADEMGLGKTVQVIAFLAYLKESGVKAQHVIVVPSSTLENWLKEIQNWAKDLEVTVYYGSQDYRRRIRFDLRNPRLQLPDVILTTYTQMNSKDDRAFFRSFKTMYAVFDEGHMLKNCTTDRYASLMRIRAERRLLLTGTPLQNDLVELVSLLHFVAPHLFARYTEDIKEILSLFKTGRAGVYQREKIEQAKTLLRPFVLRRVKSEVLNQLPPKVERVHHCQMTTSQANIYRSIVEDFRRCIASSSSLSTVTSGSSSTASVKPGKRKQNGFKNHTENGVQSESGSDRRSGVGMLMELRKAANHPLLLRTHYSDSILRDMAKKLLRDPEHRDADPVLIHEDLCVMSDFEIHRLCKSKPVICQHALPDDAILNAGKLLKLDCLLDEIKQEGCKTLLFSQFVIVLDILEEYLRLRRHQFVRLDGSTPVIERQALIERFHNEPDLFVFLLSTRAGGLGINLTAANYIIIHDIDFNPYNDRQAEDRSHRLGQMKDVTVVKLLSESTVEENMFDCAQRKLTLEKEVTASGSSDDDSKELELMLQEALTRSS